MNRIRDNLWISNIHGVRTKPLGEIGIDHVVSVCQDSVGDNVSEETGYEHFCIADGYTEGYVEGDNSFEMFAEAVDSIRVAIGADKTVLVHCHAGMSRSVTVCASAIAVREGRTFQDVLDEISSITDIAPDELLREHGARYVVGSETWKTTR